MSFPSLRLPNRQLSRPGSLLLQSAQSKLHKSLSLGRSHLFSQRAKQSFRFPQRADAGLSRVQVGRTARNVVTRNHAELTERIRLEPQHSASRCALSAADAGPGRQVLRSLAHSGACSPGVASAPAASLVAAASAAAASSSAARKASAASETAEATRVTIFSSLSRSAATCAAAM